MELKQLAFLGTYIPRRCGIATFTSDLCEAVSAAAPETACFAVAMNDRLEGYTYPDRVRFELDAGQREHYDLAADYLNVNQVDVVCVQHEYGIFGGKSGRYLLPLLRQLRTPIVTTLHTILEEPSPAQRQVMEEVCEISDRIVVMSMRAQGYLQDIYKVPTSKIRIIHHGIPDMPFVDPNYYKDQFDAAGRRMMLTFGLLNPGKGIEYAIEALPQVVERFPDLIYIVLGVTHPHVKREHGEEYRMRLQQRVRELGLERNVEFRNRFVEITELCEYLGAADLYVTPYLGQAQIVSGTLAYAMGTGKAVVSTPYYYAEDMLSEGRGRLVPFRDSQALAEVLVDLLTNEVERHAMRKRAYMLGRSMIWSQVGQDYLKVFHEARAERRQSPRPLEAERFRAERFEELPEFNPKHLQTLTDDVGVLQHARYTVPDPQHGYSTDDQARALVVVVKAAEHFPQAADWDRLASRYLSFLMYAFDPETRRFGNFMNYQREWTRPMATDDVHGRAVLALAHVVAYSENEGHRSLAMQLLDLAIPPTTSFSSPRAWASAIVGIQLYLQRYSGASSFRRERHQLAHQIFERFQRNASDDWPWLEDQLTYTNARIPQALIEVAKWLPDQAILECGIRSLKWLDAIQTSEEGHFVPIGNNGWFTRGGARARFDQQPVEAYTMLDACVTAYRVTRDEYWVTAARRAFDWFLGRN
ncbi:MAG: glycosyltransferase family 4 protein, partial [Kiritimatiellae bacterium]|nr:glycosyltransferase family 4 protein [Kiritimatiellia bacterium]